MEAIIIITMIIMPSFYLGYLTGKGVAKAATNNRSNQKTCEWCEGAGKMGPDKHDCVMCEGTGKTW